MNTTNSPFSLCILLFITIICVVSPKSYAQEIIFGDTFKRKHKTNLIYKQFHTPAYVSFSNEGTQHIKIYNGAGALKITSAPSDTIEVKATIETFSLSKKASKRFISNYLKLEAIPSENTILLKTDFEGIIRRNGVERFKTGHLLGSPVSKVNVEIFVPKGIGIEVVDNSGPILIKNVEGNIKIKDGSGMMKIENSKGNLSIADGSGRIHIRNIAGDVNLKDGSGGIFLTQVEGTVMVRDASGSLEVEEVEHSLKITDTSGRIAVRNIATKASPQDGIYIKDSSGGISAENLGTKTTIIDSSGGLSVSSVDGNLRINDTSGRISTQKVAGRLLIKDRSGRLQTGASQNFAP